MTSGISGAAPRAVVAVLDVLGRVRLTVTADEADTAVLTGLPAGLYVVRAGAGVVQFSVE